MSGSFWLVVGLVGALVAFAAPLANAAALRVLLRVRPAASLAEAAEALATAMDTGRRGRRAVRATLDAVVTGVTRAELPRHPDKDPVDR